MASITIRKLDDEVKTRLRIRAAGNGRSMEEEARLILREAVNRKTGPENLASAIRARFAPWAAWNWNCLHASRPGSIEKENIRKRERLCVTNDHSNSDISSIYRLFSRLIALKLSRVRYVLYIDTMHKQIAKGIADEDYGPQPIGFRHPT